MIKPTRPMVQWGHPLNAGLVAAWLFTEKGGTIVQDHSFSQHNWGGISGSLTWCDGIDGPAFSFDGTGNFLDCAPTSLGFTQKYLTRYSIASVFQVSSFTDYRCILCRGSGTNRNYSFYVEQTTGKLVNAYTTATNVFKFVTGATALTLNQWYRAVATFDGSTLFIYIDGKLDVSGAAAFTPENNNTILSLGSINTANKFSGVISEVRLWERALTPDEIMAWINTDYSEFKSGVNRNLILKPPVVVSTLQSAVSMM